jgi:hypothetical protein
MFGSLGIPLKAGFIIHVLVGSHTFYIKIVELIYLLMSYFYYLFPHTSLISIVDLKAVESGHSLSHQ